MMFKKTNVRVSTAFTTIPGVFFFFSDFFFYGLGSITVNLRYFAIGPVTYVVKIAFHVLLSLSVQI